MENHKPCERCVRNCANCKYFHAFSSRSKSDCSPILVVAITILVVVVVAICGMFAMRVLFNDEFDRLISPRSVEIEIKEGSYADSLIDAGILSEDDVQYIVDSVMD